MGEFGIRYFSYLRGGNRRERVFRFVIFRFLGFGGGGNGWCFRDNLNSRNRDREFVRGFFNFIELSKCF